MSYSSFRLRLHPSPLWIIFEINFFRNLSVAMLTAVFPIYLRQFVDSDAQLGLIFFIGYLAAFFSNLYSSYIVEHLKKRAALLLALIGFTILFAVFTVIEHTAILYFFFALYQFIFALFVFDIGLYVKHYSNYREIAQNAGKLGSLGNIGWLVGPLLGALVAEKYGFPAVFLASSVISLIALIVFFFIHLRGEEVHFHHQKHFFKNVRVFFRNPNLRKTYLNNAGLGFIYSIWDFLPLLMLKIGATIPIIGMTKTLMGVTQSIFEFPIGQMADRQTGERKIFIVGYALAAIFTALLGFTTDLRTFVTFFFIAATGTAFLEMTRDSYFFRQEPEKEVELISVYRTSDTFPYLIGQCFAMLVISLLSIEWWFVIGGMIATVVFISNAYRLKELKNRNALIR